MSTFILIITVIFSNGYVEQLKSLGTYTDKECSELFETSRDRISSAYPQAVISGTCVEVSDESV